LNGCWVKNINGNNEEVALVSRKNTEVVSISPRRINDGLLLDPNVNNQSVRAAYYSAAFILQRGYADMQDIDPQEIELADIVRFGLQEGNAAKIILCDEHDNGSGFVRSLFEKIRDDRAFLNNFISPDSSSSFIRHMFSDDHSHCTTACYDCLKVFRNMNFHSLLDWRLGVSLLKSFFQSDYHAGLNDNESFNDRGSYPELCGWDQLQLQNLTRLSYIQPKLFNNVRLLNGIPVINFENNIMGVHKVGIVIHPLWSTEAHGGWYGKLAQLQADMPDEEFVIMDSFNLERRPTLFYNRFIENDNNN
jgi:hypothetical protein